MSDETPESLIPYDEIVQDALRAVVGRVLGEVEQTGGLPGDHHFYITFKTRDARAFPSPSICSERFPDEMTIVIQHRFWDLKVEDDDFTVGLSFGGVPATLHVPFAAVTQFHDPAVEFALTFQANGAEEPPEEHEEAENDAPEGDSGRRPRKTAPTSSAWTSRARSDEPQAVTLNLFQGPFSSSARGHHNGC